VIIPDRFKVANAHFAVLSHCWNGVFRIIGNRKRSLVQGGYKLLQLLPIVPDGVWQGDKHEELRVEPTTVDDVEFLFAELARAVDAYGSQEKNPAIEPFTKAATRS